MISWLISWKDKLKDIAIIGLIIVVAEKIIEIFFLKRKSKKLDTAIESDRVKQLEAVKEAQKESDEFNKEMEDQYEKDITTHTRRYID